MVPLYKGLLFSEETNYGYPMTKISLPVDDHHSCHNILLALDLACLQQIGVSEKRGKIAVNICYTIGTFALLISVKICLHVVTLLCPSPARRRSYYIIIERERSATLASCGLSSLLCSLDLPPLEEDLRREPREHRYHTCPMLRGQGITAYQRGDDDADKLAGSSDGGVSKISHIKTHS